MDAAHYTPEVFHPCSSCGKPFPADELLIKRVQFMRPGRTQVVVRSRVVGRFCAGCLKKKDEDWNRKAGR